MLHGIDRMERILIFLLGTEGVKLEPTQGFYLYDVLSYKNQSLLISKHVFLEIVSLESGIDWLIFTIVHLGFQS